MFRIFANWLCFAKLQRTAYSVQRSVGSGWEPSSKIGFDWVRFRRDGMGDFFHNAFQNRYLGSFWFFENWVRFAKLHSVGRVSLGKIGGFGQAGEGGPSEIAAHLTG